MLASTHDRKRFSSTEESLNRYLQQQSSQDTKRHLARTYVLTNATTPERIIGYFTLSATSIKLASMPEAPKIPYPILPAILIGRLAIDQEFQGQGMGSALLRAALERCIVIDQEIGAYAVIVDAIHDQAAAFYEHFGFSRLEQNGLLLFISMKAALEVLM